MSEAKLRTQLGPTRHGAVVEFPRGSRFAPSAADLVRGFELELREVPPPVSLHPVSAGSASQGSDQPARDVLGRFPVVLDGEVPTCVTWGAEVHGKPSHLTQSHAPFFAPGTDARNRLRGRLDSLQAPTPPVCARARADGRQQLATDLDSIAAFCRALPDAEHHLRPPGPLRIAGMDEATLHHASHHPEEAVGLPHLAPDGSHPEVLHRLNWSPCQVREAEMAALDAFPPEPSVRSQLPATVASRQAHRSIRWRLEMAEGLELRAYCYLDRMQPQYASCAGTITQGDLPIEGMASISIELAPGNCVFRIIDIAVKATDARPGAQIVGREFGMFEIHSRSQSDVLRADEVVLEQLGVRLADRVKPTIASMQVITNVNPDQAPLLDRFTRGMMLVAGQRMLVLECAPAAYSNDAANEADKAGDVNLMRITSVGRSGRLWMAGTEAEIAPARDAAVAAIESLDGRS